MFRNFFYVKTLITCWTWTWIVHPQFRKHFQFLRICCQECVNFSSSIIISFRFISRRNRRKLCNKSIGATDFYSNLAYTRIESFVVLWKPQQSLLWARPMRRAHQQCNARAIKTATTAIELSPAAFLTHINRLRASYCQPVFVSLFRILPRTCLAFRDGNAATHAYRSHTQARIRAPHNNPQIKHKYKKKYNQRDPHSMKLCTGWPIYPHRSRIRAHTNAHPWYARVPVYTGEVMCQNQHFVWNPTHTNTSQQHVNFVYRASHSFMVCALVNVCASAVPFASVYAARECVCACCARLFRQPNAPQQQQPSRTHQKERLRNRRRMLCARSQTQTIGIKFMYVCCFVTLAPSLSFSLSFSVSVNIS